MQVKCRRSVNPNRTRFPLKPFSSLFQLNRRYSSYTYNEHNIRHNKQHTINGIINNIAWTYCWEPFIEISLDSKIKAYLHEATVLPHEFSKACATKFCIHLTLSSFFFFFFSYRMTAKMTTKQLSLRQKAKKKIIFINSFTKQSGTEREVSLHRSWSNELMSRSIYHRTLNHSFQTWLLKQTKLSSIQGNNNSELQYSTYQSNNSNLVNDFEISFRWRQQAWKEFDHNQ